MNRAKKNKNDEFYTPLVDIVDEIITSGCYRGCFQGKTVLCNCNDIGKGAFRRFFVMYFNQLGLSRLITISYGESAVAAVYDGVQTEYHLLSGNGDFRSEEAIEILHHADIVVTNPPFSLFREYVMQLIEYDKRFIIVGNENKITLKDIFPLVIEGRMRFGCSKIKVFDTPNGKKTFGNISWFTNIGIKKQHEPLTLTAHYYGNEDKYPRYDNFDAIDVDTVRNIPCDYDGLMGVPITSMSKFHPDQFAIVGEANHGSDNKYDLFSPIIQGQGKCRRLIIKNLHVVSSDAELAGPVVENGRYRQNPGRFYINGQRKYGRVIIQCVQDDIHEPYSDN